MLGKVIRRYGIVGITGCVAGMLIAGWAFSVFRSAAIMHGTLMLGTGGGGIYAYYDEPLDPHSPLIEYRWRVFYYLRNDNDLLIWWPILKVPSTSTFQVYMPYWILLFVDLYVFYVALRRIRRGGAGSCKKCGYCLHMNESGICPECGTPIGA